jgi:glycosyltransferase involved in cell wall biosynthesis
MIPSFTLVSTVYNERQRLENTLQDLRSQTLLPDEIIITDAGSTDGTFEMLLDFAKAASFRVIILQKEKCNVAEGRNMAIKAASNQLILSTDFGCRFHPDWIKSLISPFDDPAVQVVGGAYTVIESELITEPEKVGYILSNGYQVDVGSEYFIPSSRSIAYRKSVFEKIGGYCEWLTLAADDLIFGMQIKRYGIPILMVDKPYVYWGRHRTYLGYAKETFRYGLGDGESRIKFRQFSKYLCFLLCRILFILVILASLILENYYLLLLNAILSIGFLPYYHHLRAWIKLKSRKYNFTIFLKGFYMLELTHYFYIKGYIKGYFFSPKTKKQHAETLKRNLAGGYSAL